MNRFDLPSCYGCQPTFFKKLAVSIYFSLISFPSFAAARFSFIEYNLAFVLGLSLPVLLIAVLLNKKIAINWKFPALITASVLLLFYAMAHFSNQQISLSLTAATLYLALIYLWPMYNETEQDFTDPPSKFKRYSSLSLIIIALANLISIWFLPQIDAYLAWLLMASLILLIALIRIIKLIFQHKPQASRMLAQWLLTSFFAAAVFLWLNAQIGINTLIITCVLSYLATLINGCWLLVQQIYSDLSFNQQSSIQKINNDELFLYTHDPATNLPTYQHALKQFELIFNHNKNPEYAAIVFQPINFTQVNSILGHHNSDVLLLQLAYCLQQKVAKNSELLSFEQGQQVIRLARLQGLRFLIIIDLSKNHHPDHAVIGALCKQLTAAVPTAVSFKSFSLNFELAFGIAICKDHSENVSEIISHAEDALLTAQKDNQSIHYFDICSVLYTEQQLAKMESLKQDIINDQLQWFIQPQIALNDKHIQGFELTTQWHYQANKGLQDNKFEHKQLFTRSSHDKAQRIKGQQTLTLTQLFTLAELSGDIHLLARKMITQAFELLSRLHKNKNHLNVAINLSSKYLLESNLIDFIVQQSQQYNVSAKFLILEFNEKIIFTENIKVKNIIDQLRAVEINIAINQFSGSYDSLRFLRKVMINQIKINCQQLNSPNTDSTEKAIINALINLARTMNIPLIGTGIDNKTIEKVFNSMGGELVQGNVINRELSPNDINAWLNAWYQQYPSAKLFDI